MKTQGHKFLIHIIQTAMLTALLALGTTAWAQNQSNNVTSAEELKAKAEEYGRETFKRKDGRTILFSEIRKLPKKDLDNLIEHEMSDDAAAAYLKYVDKELAARYARIAEKDKELAATYADTISLIESNAAKLKKIYALTRTQGKPLTRADHEYIKAKVMDKKELLSKGLKQETMVFFEYLFTRPELFEK